MRGYQPGQAPNVRGCDALILLAGEPIPGLWTPAKKRRIRESRVQGTRAFIDAANALENPPEVIVSGSGIGIYADGGDKELDEQSPKAEGFFGELCVEWEAEALRAKPSRVVLLRTSVVLGREGGALGLLLPLFRAGLGGRLGSGQHWMPWIHVADQAMLALFAVENQEVRGPLNAAAPWPVRNADFTRALAAAVRRPAFFHTPAFAMKLAFGELGEHLLASARVVPTAASSFGFQFQYPELPAALKEIAG